MDKLTKLHLLRKYRNGGVIEPNTMTLPEQSVLPEPKVLNDPNPIELDTVNLKDPFSRPVSPMDNFKQKIAESESSNRYHVKNSKGYLGKYQFGGMALQDLGYKDSKGKWTGKDGVKSEKDFLTNKNAQENAAQKWFPLIRSRLRKLGVLKKVGQTVHGVPVTESGLIAAAHLVGVSAVKNMLKSGKIPKDANGVTALEYMEKFKDMETTQGYQDGGMIPEQTPVLQQPVQPITERNPLQDLLDQYKLKQEEYEKRKRETDLANIGKDVSDAILRYGVQRGVGDTMKAGGQKIETPELYLPEKFKAPEAPKLDDIFKQAKIMELGNKLKASKSGINPSKIKSTKYVTPEGIPVTRYGTQYFAAGKPYFGKMYGADYLKKITPKSRVELEKENRQKQEFAMKAENHAYRKITRKRELQDTDPNSEASKKWRKLFSDAGVKLTGKETAEFLKKSGNQLMSQQNMNERSSLKLAQQIEDRKLREQREDRIREQKERDISLTANDKIYKVTEDFEKHKLKQELDKQGMSFDQADGLISEIKSGNELALGALGTKMARAMGEVGVLTDADVTRYIQSQSILRKGRDYYTRLGKGKLYKDTLLEMESLINKMKKGFLVKKQEIFNRYVNKAYKNYGKPAGISKAEIYSRFGFSYKRIAHKQYSPSRNKTKIIYEDGTEEIVEGKR